VSDPVKVAFDFNLSHKFVGVFKALYSSPEFEFLHLRDLGIDGNTPDPRWADIYKQKGGRVVISGDCNIAYKPHLALAFIDNGFVSFFPQGSWASLKAHEQAAILVHSWPKIEEAFRMASAGTCWRIPCVARKGDVRLADAPLTPLIIPDSELKAIRAKLVLTGAE
jgi:hypothetical protein